MFRDSAYRIRTGRIDALKSRFGMKLWVITVIPITPQTRGPSSSCQAGRRGRPRVTAPRQEDEQPSMAVRRYPRPPESLPDKTVAAGDMDAAADHRWTQTCCGSSARRVPSTCRSSRTSPAREAAENDATIPLLLVRTLCAPPQMRSASDAISTGQRCSCGQKPDLDALWPRRSYGRRSCAPRRNDAPRHGRRRGGLRRHGPRRTERRAIGSSASPFVQRVAASRVGSMRRGMQQP